MRILSFKKLFFLSLITPILSWGLTLDKLTEGPPENMSLLSSQAYRSFSVEKLSTRQVKVLYLNYELLKELGITETDPQKLKQQIKNLAWITSSHETSKKAYADKYGGDGIGFNEGSGRAASMGKIQIKGIGVTPLYHKDKGDFLEKGVVDFHESLIEAVWGNILHHELPWGANRVIALLDTGLKTRDGSPRVLILREDPLRPAHFLPPFEQYPTNRILSLQKKFPEMLPGNLKRKQYLLEILEKKNNMPQFWRDKKLVSTFDEWIYRSTQQIARSYARRIYHGAVSPSNVTITSAWLDYETTTSNSGFGPIRSLSFTDPFGHFKEFGSLWGLGFFEELEKTHELKLRPFIKKTWNHYLNNFIHQEMISLLGFPSHIIEKTKDLRSFRNLAQALYEITQISNQTKIINLRKTPQSNRANGKIDVQKILSALVLYPENSKILKILKKEKYLTLKFKKELLAYWENYYAKSLAFVSKDSKHTFRDLLQDRSEWILRSRSDLYSSNFSSLFNNWLKQYNKTGNPRFLQKNIDEFIYENITQLDKLKSFKLQDHETIDHTKFNSQKRVLVVEGFDFIKNKRFKKEISLLSKSKKRCDGLF